MTAKAVAAVDGTGSGDHQEGSSLVLVEQAGSFARGEVADGIGQVAGNDLVFCGDREDLAKQGVRRVPFANSGQKRQGNEGREVPQGCRKGGGKRQIDRLEQFKRITDRPPQLDPPGFGHGRWRVGGADSFRSSRYNHHAS